MAKSTAARDPHANTVALDSHALVTLRYIRSSMDAAGLLAVPGSAGVAMGVVGFAASICVASAALAPHWLLIWLVAAATAFACGSAVMVHQAMRRGVALYRGPARKFLLCLAPPLTVGAVLTLALWLRGGTALELIPATWLLLYGCGVVAASSTTVRPVGLMGVLFMLLGLAALATPLQISNVLLGAGFGGLHLLFGIVLGRRRHGE